MPEYTNRLVSLAALLLCFGTNSVALSQELELKNEDIPALGSKMPAYLPDIQELSTYQRNLTTHQEISIQWDSMNGKRGLVSKQEADAYGNTSGTFTLVKQLRGQPGSPGPIDTSLYQGRVIVLGRSDAREIKCLVTIHDPRELHAEFFDKNPPERHDYVQPTATILLQFCDDPSITTLDFLQLDPHSTGKAFKTLGSLKLSRKELPVRK